LTPIKEIPYTKDYPYKVGVQGGRNMITSKLTSKAQTTIPQPVRNVLHLHPGDELAYVIENNTIILKKVENETLDNPFATFAEWDSPADREAYASL
jgi:antitoxin PrlF